MSKGLSLLLYLVATIGYSSALTCHQTVIYLNDEGTLASPPNISATHTKGGCDFCLQLTMPDYRLPSGHETHRHWTYLGDCCHNTADADQNYIKVNCDMNSYGHGEYGAQLPEYPNEGYLAKKFQRTLKYDITFRKNDQSTKGNSEYEIPDQTWIFCKSGDRCNPKPDHPE